MSHELLKNVDFSDMPAKDQMQCERQKTEPGTPAWNMEGEEGVLRNITDRKKIEVSCRKTRDLRQLESLQYQARREIKAVKAQEWPKAHAALAGEIHARRREKCGLRDLNGVTMEKPVYSKEHTIW